MRPSLVAALAVALGWFGFMSTAQLAAGVPIGPRGMENYWPVNIAIALLLGAVAAVLVLLVRELMASPDAPHRRAKRRKKR